MGSLKTPISRVEDRTTLIDNNDPNNVYIGKAAIGSPTSATVWAIQLINTNGGNISIKWSNGTYEANAVWDQRGSYSYS